MVARDPAGGVRRQDVIGAVGVDVWRRAWGLAYGMGFIDFVGDFVVAIGNPFGIGLGTTSDNVDTIGAIFHSFGAVLVNEKGDIVGATWTGVLKPDEFLEFGMLAINPATAGEHPAFKAYLQGEIDRVNGKLAQVQKIKRWVVIPGEFSIEGGELTPTMKLKRSFVNKKYKAEIDAMYRAQAA